MNTLRETIANILCLRHDVTQEEADKIACAVRTADREAAAKAVPQRHNVRLESLDGLTKDIYLNSPTNIVTTALHRPMNFREPLAPSQLVAETPKRFYDLHHQDGHLAVYRERAT